MPTPIDRLVYRSVATGRTDELNSLVELLGEAQRNNARVGLTGALAVHDGCYLQVLEGDPGLIDRLQRRLAEDPRHRDMVVLDRQRVESRAFEGWSMASARIAPALAPELEALMTAENPSAACIVGLMIEAVAGD